MPSTRVVAKSPIVTAMSVPARLRAQLRDHARREVDPVHRHAALRQRERDPPGPDPELERGAVARSPRQELDRLGETAGSPRSPRCES